MYFILFFKNGVDFFKPTVYIPYNRNTIPQYGNNNMKEVPVKSVKKALDLLSIIAFEDHEQNGFELTALSERLGLPINTAHNLLKTMTACGFTSQNKKSKYISGWKCRRLKHEMHLQDPKVKTLLKKELELLSTKIDESLVLTLLINGKRIPILRLQPDGQAIRVDESVMEGRSMYDFPTGKVLYVFANELQSDEITTENGDWPESQRESPEIIKHGYAEETNSNGVYTLAFPVLTSDGDLLGSLGCYAPIFRCDKQKQQTIIKSIKKSIDKITKILSD
jgi:DNA-binding IclR family transcriptional regulator